VNPAMFHHWGFALVKHGKSNAIETNQALQRSQPEIAVACLRNRNHRILRQPILGFFYVDDGRGTRLRDRVGGGRDFGGRGAEQQPCGCKSPTVFRHILSFRSSGAQACRFGVGPEPSLAWPSARGKRGRDWQCCLSLICGLKTVISRISTKPSTRHATGSDTGSRAPDPPGPGACALLRTGCRDLPADGPTPPDAR